MILYYSVAAFYIANGHGVPEIDIVTMMADAPIVSFSHPSPTKPKLSYPTVAHVRNRNDQDPAVTHFILADEG
jgi:hypothetical protein